MTKTGHPLYVSKISDKDVLFGRGTGPNEHVGNLTFRSEIEKRQPEYQGTMIKATRERIGYEIMNIVHSRGGRFLKKIVQKNNKGRNSNTIYEVIDDHKVLAEKIKQAFRYKKENPTPSNTSTDATASGETQQSGPVTNDTSNSQRRLPQESSLPNSTQSGDQSRNNLLMGPMMQLGLSQSLANSRLGSVPTVDHARLNAAAALVAGDPTSALLARLQQGYPTTLDYVSSILTTSQLSSNLGSGAQMGSSDPTARLLATLQQTRPTNGASQLGGVGLNTSLTGDFSGGSSAAIALSNLSTSLSNLEMNRLLGDPAALSLLQGLQRPSNIGTSISVDALQRLQQLQQLESCALSSVSLGATGGLPNIASLARNSIAARNSITQTPSPSADANANGAKLSESREFSPTQAQVTAISSSNKSNSSEVSQGLLKDGDEREKTKAESCRADFDQASNSEKPRRKRQKTS